MSGRLVLALDVGGSSVKSALVARDRLILGEVRVDGIASKGSAAEIFTVLTGVINSYLLSDRLRGVAMAFPGPFDYKSGICWIQNQGKYQALYGLPVGEKLRETLGRPELEIRFRNDAEAAILGEALYGAGAGYSRLLGLTLGTGLGSTFLVDGDPVTQSPDVPNQGWLYAHPFGTKRADDVFSTRGLLARFREQGVAAPDLASALRKADTHDRALDEAFTAFGADLGAFLSPFVVRFGAQAVLITGGISEAWDRFAPALRRSLSIPVVRGTLGKRSALLGTAALYI